MERQIDKRVFNQPDSEQSKGAQSEQSELDKNLEELNRRYMEVKRELLAEYDDDKFDEDEIEEFLEEDNAAEYYYDLDVMLDVDVDAGENRRINGLFEEMKEIEDERRRLKEGGPEMRLREILKSENVPIDTRLLKEVMQKNGGKLPEDIYNSVEARLVNNLTTKLDEEIKTVREESLENLGAYFAMGGDRTQVYDFQIRVLENHGHDPGFINEAKKRVEEFRRLREERQKEGGFGGSGFMNF